MEWRLSFSFVEQKILFNIPDYQRTAYLILKDQIKELLRFDEKHNFKSYHLKTILLELTTQPSNGDNNNVYQFRNALFNRLYKAYLSGRLFNFFIQDQNLLEVGDEQLTKVLDKVVDEVNEKEKDITVDENSTPQDIRTGFLEEMYDTFINYVKLLKKKESVDDVIISFIKLKRILRIVDEDAADSLSVKIFKSYIDKCISILPCLPEKRLSYEKLSDSVDIDRIHEYLTGEMEKIKKNEISQIEECEQVDKFYNRVGKLLNKTTSPEEHLQQETRRSLMDEFQIEYNRELNEKIRRFKLEEKYFETVCVYLEFFKKIFHTDERDNREEIQNNLERILDDIVNIDQSFESIVQDNNNKLTRFLNLFYETQNFQEIGEEVNEVNEEIMKVLRGIKYDGDESWSRIAMKIDSCLTFKERIQNVSEEMNSRFKTANNSCICSNDKTGFRSFLNYGDSGDIFLPPLQIFEKVCSAHNIN